MIPKECKRLAEVDFPIAEVSKHSAREKSIRHGHPSTLHLWWARRPLAACRAVLLALLLPDPADENCPPEFEQKARKSLLRLRGKIGGKPEDLRQALLKFIGDFANWNLATDRSYLEVSRGLVKAAHGDEAPLVVDPFAGGGSIPLEALRLGCDTFASDLNPVACLILKVLLEDIPRRGIALADELRGLAGELKKAADKELAQFYPVDPDGGRPLAYLWARTVRCESPKCGAEIPLVRSLWLSNKAGRKRAFRYGVEKLRANPPRIVFDIFEPTNEEVQSGIVADGNATCPCCNVVLAAARVRAQLALQKGGGDTQFDQRGKRIAGATLLAVVTQSDSHGREYRTALPTDYVAVRSAQQFEKKLPKGLVPDEPLNPVRPSPNARGLSAVTRFGIGTFGDLFTARQKLALTKFVELCSKLETSTHKDTLALAVSRLVNASTSLCRWDASRENIQGIYSKQAVQFVWDFCEGNPLSAATGGFTGAVDWVTAIIGAAVDSPIGQVQCADARESPLPDSSADVWFTDPPYYDSIPYADLADFFYVWLKRILPNDRILTARLDQNTGLTPKTEECVWNQSHFVNGKPKDGAFFEGCVSDAFSEGRRVMRPQGVGCVVFAHKTTEGWEALLSGMLKAGFVIYASWPITTEMATRTVARGTAALGGSVHLICRPRTEKNVGDWGQVLRELPKRVSDWMERLQSEGVRGADLVFACIGPALEIFSRYSKVETAEGREVGLPEYLVKVWEVVGRTALEHVLGTAEAKVRNGAAGALEEDARLTALFLWTMQSTSVDSSNATQHADGEQIEDDDEAVAGRQKKKGLKLIFDVVRRFAQPLGIRLPDWEGRIIETQKGVVRLLPVRERSIQLFGEDGAHGAASEIERAGDAQLVLFPDAKETIAPRVRGRRRAEARGVDRMQREATTLDRLHAAMLLQASGQASALRTLFKAEQERGPDLIRLANALSALYPKDSEEKRLVDAMLLAVPK